jgi:hypothetical protein
MNCRVVEPRLTNRAALGDETLCRDEGTLVPRVPNYDTDAIDDYPQMTQMYADKKV